MVYIHFVHATGQNSASVHTRAVLTIVPSFFVEPTYNSWGSLSLVNLNTTEPKLVVLTMGCL